MKIRGSILLRWLGLNWLLSLGFVIALGSTGCSSFLAGQAMKNYPVKVKPVDGMAAPTRYQEDFLYLKTLGEEVVPLADRIFPPDERAAMEREILQDLGQFECTHETFLLSIRRYLAAFNNSHARIIYNPKLIHFTGFYPFRIHYVSNDLYLADIALEYQSSLIGQRITAINGQSISEVEQKLSSFTSAENPWARRTSLGPFGYSRPDLYRIAGLSSSATNDLKLEFAGHPPVSIAPKWKGELQWHGVSHPPHPITARSEHQYDFRIFPEQNYAYLQFNACFDKTAILDGLEMVRPWVRPLVRAWLGFQFRRKKPANVLRGIYDPERPVFKDYLASSIRDISRLGITNLVIDLRRNAGGEGELIYQLLYHLTHRNDLRDLKEFQYNFEVLAHYSPKKSRELHSWYLNKFGTEPPSRQLLPTPEQDRPFFAAITNPKSPYYVAPDRPVFSGKTIVLVNQNTGSAASDLVGLIQDNQLALTVGTTTAGNPIGPTGMTPFKLPRSGVLVSLPTRFCERAVPSNGNVLQPDYWVENSLADIQIGRDAAFEKALELLHRE
jgi:hypothetical protein